MTELALLVESTVMSLSLSWQERSIRIDVTSPWGDKKRISIIATGITECRVEDVRLYNIIDRVTIFDAEESQKRASECASLLFFLLNNREPTSSDLESPLLRERRALIQRNELTLLAIDAVCGATFLVLAENVVIQPTAGCPTSRF